ncbi:MAG TPA: hypothetical protein PKY77_07905 [Phycisphaerae bacterium]|nr:hypothetical protein [Phycisphaerae bacterium]HRY66514.1 hypothetical protein [Phycisphaerae bacterium]HSA28626.1 hypothetical protein [Phycisphaerae bacterium]
MQGVRSIPGGIQLVPPPLFRRCTAPDLAGLRWAMIFFVVGAGPVLWIFRHGLSGAVAVRPA